MIRIAYIIDSIEAPTAGTEKQLLLLLRNLDRARFDPLLCVLRTSRWVESEFRECPVLNADIPSFRSMRTYDRLRDLARFLREKRVAIVQAHFNDANNAGCIAARMAGNAKVIASRRNQGYSQTLTGLAFTRLLNRWVSAFVANCNATRRFVEANEGVARDRIEVIYNGLDLRGFDIDRDAARGRLRREMGVAPDAVVVGMVANLRPVKAIDVFLRAASLLSRNLPRARFAVVGDGPLAAELRSLTAQLGLAERVCFLGVRTDIPEVLSAFDIGVLSSSSESFSNSIVEYLAANLPVVCTDAGGCSEAVEEGRNGHVVPVGDWRTMAERLEGLIREGRPPGFEEYGRRKVERMFSLEAMTSGFERLYCRLASDR